MAALVWAFSGLYLDLYPLFFCMAGNVYGRQGVAWRVVLWDDETRVRHMSGPKLPAPRVLYIGIITAILSIC